HYHGYLREPPVEWAFMPLFEQVAPDFSKRYPEAAVIFDNLHMLHDNIDDVLCSPDRFPDRAAQRGRILEILSLYLHRNHAPVERFAEYHAASMEGMPHGGVGHEAPPSAEDVLEGRANPAQSHPMSDHPSHHP